jgi:hypothetical protein
MGPAWVSPAHFRFGASSLLTSLEHQLGFDGKPQAPGAY